MEVVSLLLLAKLLYRFNQEYAKTNCEEEEIRKVMSKVNRELGL